MNKSIWRFDVGSEDDADNLLPVQRIAGSFLAGKLIRDPNFFSVLVLPNQLCLWEPFETVDSEEQDQELELV